MITYNTSILIDGCEKLNIHLTDTQTAQFIHFYEMLAEKNKVMNLTAITQWDDVVTKHFLDSLLIYRAFDFNFDNILRKSTGSNVRQHDCFIPGDPMPVDSIPEYSIQSDSIICGSETNDSVSDNSISGGFIPKVLDIGTGAGFPGIPLKIAFPNFDITLADSLNKRILFLDEVINELHLENVHVIHARAEDLGRNKDHREMYDLVVSRAVANLSSLSEYCIPFVRKSGYFAAYKSINIDTEIRDADTAVRLLGGRIENIKNFYIPETDVRRSFVIIKKVHRTPEKYPRKAGIPLKQPL